MGIPDPGTKTKGEKIAALHQLRFLHILAVVFMALPLFNLIVVNERAMFGKAHLRWINISRPSSGAAPGGATFSNHPP